MSDTPACFHCGLPIPAGVDFSVTIAREPHAMCCRGCQAVAQVIVDNGLADYYKNRSALPGRGQEVLPAELDQLMLYDNPQIQQSFVLDSGEHIKQAVLILEGITCAACVWLNERHLMQLPGVKNVQVNYANHRARVSWDEREITLSKILAEIQLLGYNAHPYSAQSASALREKQRRVDLRRLLVAGFVSMQVMMFAVGLYAGHYYGMDPDTARLMRWASLLLTLPAVFYAALPFYRAAWYALKTRHLNMDVPVTLAIVSAFVGSVWVTWHDSGVVYFDTITMFVFILLGSRFLEAGAREKSVEAAENLLKLAPAMATRVRNGQQQLVPVVELALDDLILAKPGEAIAADGCVTDGTSSADEALLTGESRPVPKRVGERVIAGSINLESPLTIRVTGVGESTLLAGIVRMLDRAQAQKPRLAQVADRVAAYFTWLLLAFTLAVGIAWWLADPARTFEIVLAVLVVSCPCALSIAAPAAIAAASSRLLKHGILLTQGHALETLSHVNRVVLDKTGTLTFGKPVLRETVALADMPAQRCLMLAASLQQASEHPIAKGFLDAVSGELLTAVSDAERVAGRGVRGRIEGVPYVLGNAALLPMAPPVLSQPLPDGATLVWLADAQRILAAFVLADQLRPEAAGLIRQLQSAGIGVTILSGDGPAAVAHVARELGVADARAGLHPDGKLAALQDMQAQGEVVAMVGDGVNDAPVLAGAQVSLAMGGGTQVARASSDIVLLSENLNDVWEALRAGRASMTVMRSNFAWAVAYNAIALPAAAFGYIPPWVAALGMSASSLIVVLNALRLR